MPTYRVHIHGRRLIVRRWLFFRKQLGFYLTRYVDAPTAAVAEATALAKVRGEPRLVLVAIQAPQLAVEEINEVEGPAAEYPETGIVFYEHDDGESAAAVT